MENEFYRKFYNIPYTVPDDNIEEYVNICHEIDILNENQQLPNDKLKELRQKLRSLKQN